MLTPQNNDTQLKDLLKVLIDHGYKGMLEVFETLLNEAAKIERSEALRAAPYERAEDVRISELPESDNFPDRRSNDPV